MIDELRKGENEVAIKIGKVVLNGNLGIPKGAKGIVVFAHGSGSSRFSPRNNYVAEELRKAGLATFLMDLLTEKEEAVDMVTSELRFDIPMLAERVVETTKWLKQNNETKELKIGYFGASTGAAAALIAAAKLPKDVQVVVSRGGRPDMAKGFLDKVKAPTLLIVGSLDDVVIGMNKEALAQLTCEKKMEIVDGATHLFEEPGKLEEVATLAKKWFVKHLS